MNIGIGIPSPECVPAEFALDNLPSIIAHTKNHLNTGDNIYLSYQMGVRTDRNRNMILQRFLGKVDYVLWLDVDMLYPHDIITKYLEHDFDVIGCLYFKRSSPYDPVAYLENKNSEKPFLAMEPRRIEKDKVYEVGGLGYGGMMVNMKVYEKMGEDRWCKYGDNYHLPYPNTGKLTHDLQFCQKAKEYGFQLFLHGGVRPSHLAVYPVTENDFKRCYGDKPPQAGENPFVLIDNRQEIKVNVIMPATDMVKAMQTAKILKSRAGVECNVIVVEDRERQGFIKTFNQAVVDNKADFYVYVAQDASPGRDWLKLGLETIRSEKKGLLAFNDGKWQGKLASFGLISQEFINEHGYDGKPLNPSYKSHYADTELTLIAKENNQLAYNPNAVLMEVDPDKESKSVNTDDKKLFGERKLTNFDGKVSQELSNIFS